MIPEIQTSMAMQEEPERLLLRREDEDEQKEQEKDSSEDRDAFEESNAERAALDKKMGRTPTRTESRPGQVGRGRHRSSVRPRPPIEVRLRMAMEDD